MANQKRQLSGTQTARTGTQPRRSQSGASSARRAADGTKPAARTRAGASPNGSARGRPAAGTPTAEAVATGWTPRWPRVGALGLSVIGLGLSIYLTIAHLAGARVLACSSKGLVNCEAVTTSPQSMLFGIFPVAELGLAFFAFMTVINLPWAWQPEWRWLPARGPLAAPRMRRALPVAAWRVRLAAIVIGILFILYLVYTELITLRTVCLWCTYVHITTFVLFVVLVAQATFWGSPAKAAGDSTARSRSR